MDTKNIRHMAIKQIIKSNHIDSQDLLLEYLEKQGFSLTQATLSRDLKQLKVVKVSDRKGGYYYTFMEQDKPVFSEKAHVESIERGFVSMEFSSNFGVLKTYPGHAQSVAFALDNLSFDSILGTIAGDDTILIIPREGFDQEMILNALKNKIPILKEEL